MKFRKIKHFKIIFALISTNLFLFLAMSFSQGSDPKINIRLNHKMVLLPVELFVPHNKGSGGNLVTLYDDLNNIVIKNAYIYFEDDPNGNLFKVEIEDKDLNRIINFKGKSLRAFPQVETASKQVSENYELVF